MRGFLGVGSDNRRSDVRSVALRVFARVRYSSASLTIDRADSRDKGAFLNWIAAAGRLRRSTAHWKNSISPSGAGQNIV